MSLIRIERKFTDLADDTADQYDTISNYWNWNRSSNENWDKVLLSPRVILVCEAGTGKTFECKAEQEKLWSAGKSAFYLELSELAQSDCVKDMFNAEEKKRFSSWQSAQFEVATFFLDSIDELALTRGIFAVALKRFAKTVNGQLERIHVVITSRPPVDIELEKIQRFLPVPDTNSPPLAEVFADQALNRNRRNAVQDGPPTWRKVALLPLDEEQIELLAITFGVKESELFLRNIRQFGALELAGRPKDLEDMCSSWIPNSPFASLSEQIENNVLIKLKPHRDEDSDHLTAEKALEGSQRLALTALLTRKLTIRYSSDSDVGHNDSALDPENVLNDWNGKEVKALLNRAMFTHASYGRVRFHHRSAIEYLASKKLKGMLEQGKPISEIKRLLFGETPQGIKVLKPSLRPVTAWLAQDIQWLFDEVLNREPAVLLIEGDPGVYRDEQKIKILKSYMEYPDNGIQLGSWLNHQHISRFASPCLTDDAELLWEKGVEKIQCRFVLLELIKNYPSTKSGDMMFDLLMEPKSNIYDRRAALEILISTNDKRVDDVIASMQKYTEKWPSNFRSFAITKLFPEHMNKTVLEQSLKQLALSPEDDYEIDSYWSKLISNGNWSIPTLDELREVLTKLVMSSFEWNKEKHLLTTKPKYLIKPLLTTCNRLLVESSPTPDTLFSCTLAYRLAKNEYSVDEWRKELKSNIRGLSSVSRKQLFWIDADMVENHIPNGKDDLFRKLFRINEGVMPIEQEKDNQWIIKTLSDPEESVSNRHLMLLTAVRHLGSETDERLSYVEGLRKFIEDNVELLEELNIMLKPQPKNEQLEALEEKDRLRTKEFAQREQENIDSWKNFWAELVENPDELFTEELEEGTAWDLWKVMRNNKEHRENAGWSRKFIEQYFDPSIADKLRETLKKLWRKNTPSLPSERTKENHKILMIWETGLSGISAESEDPYWAGKLAVEEAKLAARYVPIALNGFPFWLESLVAAYPIITQEILCGELLHELSIEATPNNYFQFLQSIEYASESVKNIFVPTLVNWLRENGNLCRPGEAIEQVKARLARAINIVLASDMKDHLKELQILATNYCSDECNKEMFSIWLPTLICLSPALGINRLTELLVDVKPEQYGIAVSWFNWLFNRLTDARKVEVSLKRVEPGDLLKLIRLIYTYIKPEHDVKRTGTFSPDERDNAQMARSQLVNVLMNTSGSDAWQAKIKLTEDPLFSDLKNNLFNSAREHEAVMIDQSILTEDSINIFMDHGYSPPKTTGDMFQLMKDRLHDIEELLLSDESPREEWANIRIERVMRRAIARQLKNMSKGMYTVTQENVTADEKETDIRIQTPDIQGIIELKIGDSNYSGNYLRNTIKDQLFSKYMAGEDCHAGCLLITVAKDRNWKHPDTNVLIDINGLEKMLEEAAQDLMEKIGFKVKIAIVILDLRSRI